VKRYLDSLPSYLGGKRSIAREIMREVDLPQGATLLDPFMGGGSVSMAGKALGYRVQANDLNPISEVLGKALIENGTRTLEAVEQAAALTTTAKSVELPDDRELSLPENCREVLRHIATYERQREGGTTKWLLRAWLVKLALSLAMWGVPTMAGGRRKWDELTPGQAGQLNRTGEPIRQALKAAESLNGGIFDNGQENTMDRGDAIEWLTDREGDVVYIDPPYPGTLAYEDVYVGVNRLIEPEWAEPSSAFSEADGWRLLAKVFDAAEDVPLWVVSMGTGGDPEKIAEMMTERGREPTWHPVQHKHLAALKKEHADEGDELLIVGKR